MGGRKPKQKQCLKCLKERNLKKDFYLSNSSNYADNRYPICKACLRKNLTALDDNPMSVDAIESVKKVLLEMNKPFIYSLYVTSIEEWEKTGNDVFGNYMKNLHFSRYKDQTWEDSEFGAETLVIEEQDEKTEENNEKNIITDKKITSPPFKITQQMINKWGYGYSPEEYRAFEQKYAMLKNNYQEKTAMHTEALLTYIRYRVKEEMATAKGDVKHAKEWGQLAQKAAQDAKINPSQLSKSDLSDGLDTFGQLVRSVEQAVDIIPILPQFKEKPQDKVDFTLWCYVNYIRDLKGLPLAEYEEIYKFYEERKKEYEQREENM